MRKLIMGMAALALLFTSCEKDQPENANELAQQQVDMSDFYLHTDFNDEAGKAPEGGKSCYTMKNLNRLLKEDDKLYKKMYDIEKNSRSILAKQANANKGKPGGGGGGTTPPPADELGTISIPVWVTVVYSNSQENISAAQVQSQIDVMNADFRAQNSDASNTPSEFADLVADSEVQFTLAGVRRYSTTTTQWGTNDAVKEQYPPVTPDTHLNIWVCNIGGGILGYAQFPGGPAATDGVVVGSNYFGDTGYVSAPYDKGRTVTHEVGHYLNLRHIWGDGQCKQDDFVNDTPESNGPNYGCPSYPTENCRSTDMTMNYMDYTYDTCMYMFSEGQKSRLRTVFASGGPRAAMAP
jgi:hypothetical protein